MNIDHDTLIAYALGMLSEQEMQMTEQHLKTNPEDALEVKRYLNSLAAVVMTEDPEIVPWIAEQNSLTRIRAQGDTLQTVQPKPVQPKQVIVEEDSRVQSSMLKKSSAQESTVIRLEPPESRRKYQWGLGLALAASLAAFVFYGPFSTWYKTVQLNQQIVESIQKSGAISTALVNDADETTGTLVKQTDNSLLVVLNEKLSDEQVYQAWNIVEGQPQSMGLYQEGIIQVSGFEAGNIFGITVEPAGGSEQPTSTPIVIYEL